MKIKLTNNGNYQQYTATNEAGHTIQLAGDGSAVGPMQSVLMAGAACSAIDVEIILKKMKQDLEKIEVEVDGKRAEDQTPKVFTDIHLHYILSGNIKTEKAESAVSMSVEKYCSVLTMLMATVKVTHSFEIIS